MHIICQCLLHLCLKLSHHALLLSSMTFLTKPAVPNSCLQTTTIAARKKTTRCVHTKYIH